MTVPFKPTITNEIDTQYFDEDFTKEEPKLTPPDAGKIFNYFKFLKFILFLDDPQAGVGENVHFQDFTFAPETGSNFK